MLTLATYIEYQLMTRHYAFVPGVGAWMLRNVEADGLTAPHQEVFFNRLASHDDGMIASLMMEAEGLSYDAAKARIAYEAGQWHSTLQREGKVQIQGIGELRLDGDQALCFTAAPVCTPAYFGLENITLAVLTETIGNHQGAAAADEASASTTQADREQAPVVPLDTTSNETPRLYWLQHVAACLLIIAGLLSVSTGSLTDAERQRDYASMLDTEILSGNASPYTLVQESWEEYVVSTEVVTEAVEAATAPGEQPATVTSAEATSATAVTDAPIATTDPTVWIDSQLATERAMQESPSGKLYYIIVASCSSDEEAKRVCRRLSKQGYGELSVLERDGRFRLYINYFQVKEEAETYLQQFRETTKFKDAWLLPVRAQSLSHIIKNTYNGNQLSMELPHLNTTAERDQG